MNEKKPIIVKDNYYSDTFYFNPEIKKRLVDPKEYLPDPDPLPVGSIKGNAYWKSQQRGVDIFEVNSDQQRINANLKSNRVVIKSDQYPKSSKELRNSASNKYSEGYGAKDLTEDEKNARETSRIDKIVYSASNVGGGFVIRECIWAKPVDGLREGSDSRIISVVTGSWIDAIDKCLEYTLKGLEGILDEFEFSETDRKEGRNVGIENLSQLPENYQSLIKKHYNLE